MKVERKKQLNLWDVATAVIAVLLLVNFLTFCVLCIAAIGMAFDPVLSFLTGAELLLGLLFLLLAKRMNVSKLWKRLLAAGVICNGLIVAFICVTAIAMLAMWQ